MSGELVVSIPAEHGGALEQALLDAAPLETGCFCLVHRVERDGALRFVLGQRLEAIESWSTQGERNLTPTGAAISAAISAAVEADCGLAFLHTHPMTTSVPRLSPIDVETTVRLGRAVAENLGSPLFSLVLSNGGWGGAASEGKVLTPLRISLVGRHLRMYSEQHSSRDEELDDRQRRALGNASSQVLRNLRVTIVGAGGLGSPLAETLVRMGVGELRLIDDDLLDTPSNARRVFGVTKAQTQLPQPRAKVEVVADYLCELDLGSHVIGIRADVTHPEAHKHLLMSDLVFTTTDTHSSRAVVSELCVRAVIPLIDSGVRVGSRAGALDSLYMERRIQLPEGPCLWCWGLDAARVRGELLSREEREKLQREGYIAGDFEGGPVPSVAALTVTAAGTCASAMLGMLAGSLDAAPLGRGLETIGLDSGVLEPAMPDPACVCSRYRPN